MSKKNSIMAKKLKSKSRNNSKSGKILKNLFKVFLILVFVFAIYYTQSSYSNSISLLAVSENSNNSTQFGSIVNLNLKISPGSGNIYVNLNTIEEVDTQISIINSQKITCKLFNLNCENYDFYYDFTNSAVILKGPSAGGAISILTVKTFLHEKINPKIAITGSLNSGGLIGVVGGIDEKIKVANKLGFEKVLIPKFSTYNSSFNYKIGVVKVIDIISAYNNFNSKKYKLKTNKINKNEYLKTMKILGENICQRTKLIKSNINFSKIKENSTQKNHIKVAQKTFNNSFLAKNNLNYYSQGSFCFNSNINYRIVDIFQKNYSKKELNLKISEFKKEVNLKHDEIISNDYKKKIITINDFYVYLILNDRIEETKKLLNEIKKIDEVKNLNNNSNLSFEKNYQKSILFSSAIERFYTVKIWEKFITHFGNQIFFNDEKIANACFKINKELNIKNELLKKYKINFLDEKIKKVNELMENHKNNYYCIYLGFQTKGDVNSILNSIGITNSNLENYTKEFLDFTKTRLSVNSNGNFPLIPIIYSEYSKDLYDSKDYITSNLYSNYALVYSDLNLYLEKKTSIQKFSNLYFQDLIKNPIFIFSFLILIVFL